MCATYFNILQENYDDEKNFNKSLHILEDGGSGVQVGDIEQVTF